MTGDDVYGRVVNLAARVTQSARGGELVVTDGVRITVRDLRGVAFDGPHPRTFKGIGGEVAVYLASRRLAPSGPLERPHTAPEPPT